MVVIIDHCGLLSGRLPPPQDLQAASTPYPCRGWVCENVRYRPDGSSEVESALNHGLISPSSTSKAQLAGRGAGSPVLCSQSTLATQSHSPFFVPIPGNRATTSTRASILSLDCDRRRNVPSRILFLATVGNQTCADGKLLRRHGIAFAPWLAQCVVFFFCCDSIVPPLSRTLHFIDSRSVHHSVHIVVDVPHCVGSFRSSPRLSCINTMSNRGSSPGILRGRDPKFGGNRLRGSHRGLD